MLAFRYTVVAMPSFPLPAAARARPGGEAVESLIEPAWLPYHNGAAERQRHSGEQLQVLTRAAQGVYCRAYLGTLPKGIVAKEVM